MASQYSSYNVDIAMCIDSTGSMGPLLDMVKNNALRFYDDFARELEYKNKHVSRVRVRVISFRDYVADGKEAMLLTPFFDLPMQAEQFRSLVAGIEAKGGGDIPEDGLEALAYAMKSDWTKDGYKRRHVIVLWTDAPAHPIGFGRAVPNYPEKMARDFNELTEWWRGGQSSNGMEKHSKRLLLFAPPEEPWNDIPKYWDNTLFFPSKAGQGLGDQGYQEILNAICGSI